jgi:hypothetical protein
MTIRLEALRPGSTEFAAREHGLSMGWNETTIAAALDTIEYLLGVERIVTAQQAEQAVDQYATENDPDAAWDAGWEVGSEEKNVEDVDAIEGMQAEHEKGSPEYEVLAEAVLTVSD